MMTIAHPGETEKMLEKNLKLLPPWLQEAVNTVSGEEMQRSVQIEWNEAGQPLCVYHGNEGSFHITGRDPVREAARWAKGIDGQISSTVFLYGCGFGYPIFELFAQKPPHTQVMVFEEDRALFRAMLCHFDFEALIKTGKLMFFAGGPEVFEKAFDEAFHSVFFIGSTYPATAFTLPAQRHFKQEYLKLHQWVFQRMAFTAAYLGNDHQDNMIGFMNLMHNMGEILKSPGIGCLKDAYKGYPAFIVANGPSLDKNIRELHNIRGRGLILCAESAILPLTRNQIQPDILVVIERIKETYTFHFEGRDYPPEIALICLALVDRRVFPSFAGEKIPLLRKGEETNEWLDEHLGGGYTLDAGGNVSHLAAQIAVELGANPIVFVGQDLAYGQDNTTHSRDSIYSEEKGRVAREKVERIPIVYVEGNDGAMIRTNELWRDCKTGLEQKIAAHPEVTFLNATVGGARISGARHGELRDFIEEYCIAPLPCAVCERIAACRPGVDRALRRAQLGECIRDMKEQAQSLYGMAEKTAEAFEECQKTLMLLQKNNGEGQRERVEAAYQKNLAVFQEVVRTKLYRCFAQQVLFAEYYLLNRLGAFDVREKLIEAFRIHGEFLDRLNLVLRSVSVHMEDAIYSLEELYESMEKEGGDDGNQG